MPRSNLGSCMRQRGSRPAVREGGSCQYKQGKPGMAGGAQRGGGGRLLLPCLLACGLWISHIGEPGLCVGGMYIAWAFLQRYGEV